MEHLDLSRNYEGLSATNIAEMMSHSLSHSKIRHLSFNYMGWNELPPKMLEWNQAVYVVIHFFFSMNGYIFDHM
jgi:hypothetical protein